MSRSRGSATCRGFAVGRTIFEAPARQWLSGEIDDAVLVQTVRASFEALIDAWQRVRAPLKTEVGSETTFHGIHSR